MFTFPEGDYVRGFGPGGYALAIHPQSTEIATGEFKWLNRYQVNGKLLQKIEVQSEVRSVAYSPDGNTMAIGCNKGHIHVLRQHGDNYCISQSFLVSNSSVVSLAFHPTDQVLVAASFDGTVQSINLTSGIVSSLFSDCEGLQSMRLSPDGQLILTSGGSDCNAKIWHYPSGSGTAVLRKHTWTLFGVAFRADQNAVATVSRDGRVICWRRTRPGQ
jgi:WD40 repeat protein